MKTEQDEKWAFVIKTMNALEQAMEKQSELLSPLDLMPESLLYCNYDAIVQSLINSMEFILGDKYENLQWYVYENDFGNREMEAGLEDNMFPIKNITDLRRFMEL